MFNTPVYLFSGPFFYLYFKYLHLLFYRLLSLLFFSYSLIHRAIPNFLPYRPGICIEVFSTRLADFDMCKRCWPICFFSQAARRCLGRLDVLVHGRVGAFYWLPPVTAESPRELPVACPCLFAVCFRLIMIIYHVMLDMFARVFCLHIYHMAHTSSYVTCLYLI